MKKEIPDLDNVPTADGLYGLMLKARKEAKRRGFKSLADLHAHEEQAHLKKNGPLSKDMKFAMHMVELIKKAMEFLFGKKYDFDDLLHAERLHGASIEKLNNIAQAHRGLVDSILQHRAPAPMIGLRP